MPYNAHQHVRARSILLSIAGIPAICVTVAVMELLLGRAAWADPPAQTVGNLTVTSVSDVDYGGEVVEITVSQPVVTGCTYASAYVVRDANIIKGSLALATTALITGNSVNLYVTGACDTTGQPLVASVSLN